jgi:RNA recognition motif-containing protein
MVKNIYVGNLPISVTEAELRELFEQHGTVHSVRVVEDRATGRPRGFAFIEMDEADAPTAIQATHGKYFAGRILRVNEAKEGEPGQSRR